MVDFIDDSNQLNVVSNILCPLGEEGVEIFNRGLDVFDARGLDWHNLSNGESESCMI